MKTVAVLLLASCCVWTAAVRSAGLKEWRKRSEMNAYDVLAVVERSKAFGEFQKSLRADYKTAVRSVLNDSPHVDVSLETMVFVFLQRSHKYMSCGLLEYFDLVAGTLCCEELRDGDGGGDAAVTLRRRIRLPDDYAYCAHTLFYDFGRDDESLLDGTYYFRTLSADDGSGDVAAQADRYRREFGDKRKKCPLPAIGEDDADRLTAVKRTMADFSKAFCSPRTPPMVSDFLLDRRDVAVRNPSRFVAYALRVEKCSVTFESSDAVKSQSSRITSWDCGGILETEEYNITRTRILQKYKKREMEETRMSILEMIMNYLCPRFLRKSNEERTNLSEESNEEPESSERNDVFTLVSLKNKLKSNNYYLNAVVYSNIASEVVILVAIKEGKKILKGARRVMMGKYCADSPEEKIVRDMLEMWSTLTAFKNLFDKLLFSVQKTKRVDFRKNRPKSKLTKTFQSKVNLVLYLLTNPSVQSARKNCSGILRHLMECLTNTAEYYSPIKVKREQYDFTQPILHVAELYRFNADNFL